MYRLMRFSLALIFLGTASIAWAATPYGSIAFVDGMAGSCPAGLVPLLQANGYALVGTTDPSQGGEVVGQKLGDQEVREHGHGFTAYLPLPPKVMAAAGGAGTDLAKSKVYTSTGTTSDNSSDLPFMQMQVCVQDDISAVDTMPPGSISFFSASVSNCPASWMAFPPGHGRLVVPLMAGGINAGVLGFPLANREDRLHQHALSAQVDIRRRHIIAANSCCNHNPARKRDETAQGATDGASMGVPYVQYLVCQKTAATVPGPVSSRVVTFFGIQDTCPTGWSANDEMRGRILIGLPDQAGAQATFGGPPLENQETRGHAHAFSGNFNTSKTEVVAASGTTLGHHDWAKRQTYSYSGNTDSETNGVPPYVQLLACTKD